MLFREPGLAPRASASKPAGKGVKRLRTRVVTEEGIFSRGLGSSRSAARSGLGERVSLSARLDSRRESSSSLSVQTRALAQTISRLFSLRWTTVRALKLMMVRGGLALGAEASS